MWGNAQAVQVRIGTDPYTLFKNADWVILLGAHPRTPGKIINYHLSPCKTKSDPFPVPGCKQSHSDDTASQRADLRAGITRAELLDINGQIFREQVRPHHTGNNSNSIAGHLAECCFAGAAPPSTRKPCACGGRQHDVLRKACSIRTSPREITRVKVASIGPAMSYLSCRCSCMRGMLQGRALDAVAARDCKVLVVGNPCNTNALICMENAPRLPRRNFHALTRLDENRAKCQLALRAGRFYTSLSRVAVWGNHSTTLVRSATEAPAVVYCLMARCICEHHPQEREGKAKDRGMNCEDIWLN